MLLLSLRRIQVPLLLLHPPPLLFSHIRNLFPQHPHLPVSSLRFSHHPFPRFRPLLLHHSPLPPPFPPLLLILLLSVLLPTSWGSAVWAAVPLRNKVVGSMRQKGERSIRTECMCLSCQWRLSSCFAYLFLAFVLPLFLFYPLSLSVLFSLAFLSVGSLSVSFIVS